MKTKAQEQFDQQIRQIQHSLDEQDLRLQFCTRQNEIIRQKLFAIAGDADLKNVVISPIALRQIAVANGKVFSPEQMKKMRTDDYDVVLNYIERKLFARKDPNKHTKLEKCVCKNIGKDRLKLFRFMLEHPKVPICEETIPYVYGDIASMSAHALAKSIGELRKCLWQAPYIITEPDWGESINQTGSMYLLNEKYKYLVIKYQI